MTMTTSTIPGVEYSRDLHAIEPWLNLARQLRQASASGCAVIAVSIVVDESGDPLLWTKPQVTMLEPRRGFLAALEALK